MKILKPSQKTLAKAVKTLRDGGVIIVPTDPVYGFVADATDKKAVAKIYKIKRRPKSKPLPIFVSSIKTAREIAIIDNRVEKILKKHWPGKYTFILKRSQSEARPRMLYGQEKKTVALRIPNNKFLQKSV